jgi:hypothetical protein
LAIPLAKRLSPATNRKVSIARYTKSFFMLIPPFEFCNLDPQNSKKVP